MFQIRTHAYMNKIQIRLIKGDKDDIYNIKKKRYKKYM